MYGSQMIESRDGCKMQFPASPNPAESRYGASSDWGQRAVVRLRGNKMLMSSVSVRSVCAISAVRLSEMIRGLIEPRLHDKAS